MKHLKYKSYSKQSGIGSGWWSEPERHRLARLGFKTGTKLAPQRPYPPYLTAPQHGILEYESPLSQYFGRRARLDDVFDRLKRQGWQVREDKSALSPGGGWEAWRGKNYISFTPTHWKKVKIDKVFIKDSDVGVRLKKIFRKPVPYRLDESGEPVKEKKKKKFIFFNKT